MPMNQKHLRLSSEEFFPMTESRPPIRTAGGTVHPDQDTTALPRIPEPPAAWAPPQPSATPDSQANTGDLGGFGSKLTAAGASAVAAATSAVASAKDAVRGVTSSSAEAPVQRSSAGGSASGSAGASSSTVGSAASPGASPSGRGSRSARAANRQPRRARLTLSHINVYSVFKFSCVLAIALFFVWLIMVGVLYGVLDVAGVLTQINHAVARISGNENQKDVVTGSLVFGGAIIIGAVYIVLFIAMSTIGSMVYNLCADLVGGVEVTLSERE
jgi:hypothetical protein